MKEGNQFVQDLFGEPYLPPDPFEKRKPAPSTNVTSNCPQTGDGNRSWVDPADCRIWAQHDRAYNLLTEENCSDLITGIRAQGRQEFPAIVRRTTDGDDTAYEVICGARRHFAVSWLRENGHPELPYLIELRDLTDEEAFRIADVENRDREDISDFERACAYARALETYYGGKQVRMAERLEVSESWLSRYLTLAKLPAEIVDAYDSIRDITEVHARKLKPLLGNDDSREKVIAVAQKLAGEKAAGCGKDGATVLKELLAAVLPRATAGQADKVYGEGSEKSIRVRASGKNVKIEFDQNLSRAAFEVAIRKFVEDRFGST
ncbi:ParB/RepB/Spo0J family partition protein [Pseudoruegeria sp. SK021]|uniref:ParB/RepB/Spo0J family partition protein n=1 Tax=Pseudoruegeria sp. SK021 TaxID=1933035 RepID=UPI000A265735|nr:ParB/RepB/Spo0J family partition protein [Pseudoruegeria sp. SK021]OSP53721.1 hypothetical protein BV911_16400 [Pseudoruegeria sp. SK021]